jgi:hypothetical protein
VLTIFWLCMPSSRKKLLKANRISWSARSSKPPKAVRRRAEIRTEVLPCTIRFALIGGHL